MKINWKIRFKKDNLTFILRFILALLVPVLTYFGMETQDLTSWQSVFDLLKNILSNPYLIVLIIFNAINMIPDPTTKGLSDSTRALTYDDVNGGKTNES